MIYYKYVVHIYTKHRGKKGAEIVKREKENYFSILLYDIKAVPCLRLVY